MPPRPENHASVGTRPSNGERPGIHHMTSSVLSDHHPQGQTLVTPFNQLNPVQQEVLWTDDIIPQILWIALLHEYNGYPKGQQLAILLSRAARILTNTDTRKAYYAASEYESISTDEWASIRDNIRAYGCLQRVVNALIPLESFCKETPFSELLADTPAMPRGDAEKLVKSAVRRLLLRRDSLEATMVQYTVGRIAFASNKVKVFAHLSLARPDAVNEYPRTDQSRHIASRLRELVSILFGVPEFNPHISSATWVRQFWDHCLLSTPCEY